MTLRAKVLVVVGVAIASSLGGYAARVLVGEPVAVDRVVVDRVTGSATPAPTDDVAPVGGHPEPATATATARSRPAAPAPPRLGHFAMAGDRNLLVSREDVDRELAPGIATNGAASRLVGRVERQLRGATDDVVLDDCFQRAHLATPRSLVLELEIRSSADSLELVSLRVAEPSRELEDCVRGLVGTIRLLRMASEPTYLARDGTVQLELGLAGDQ